MHTATVHVSCTAVPRYSHLLPWRAPALMCLNVRPDKLRGVVLFLFLAKGHRLETRAQGYTHMVYHIDPHRLSRQFPAWWIMYAGLRNRVLHVLNGSCAVRRLHMLCITSAIPHPSRTPKSLQLTQYRSFCMREYCTVEGGGHGKGVHLTLKMYLSRAHKRTRREGEDRESGASTTR